MFKLLELIIALLIVVIPYAATNLTYDPTIIKTTFIKAGFLIILAIYLISTLKDKKIRIKKIPPVFSLVALAIYLVLNFIFKCQFASSEKLFTTLLFFSFFFILVHFSYTPLFIKLITWEFFSISSLIGLASLIFYFTHFNRTRLFFYNANFLASYFVFSIPLSLCLLYERYKKHPAGRQLTGIDLLLYCLVLIQIGGFITTFSRAGSLGFSASVLFLIFLCSSKKRWKRLSIFILLFIISVSVIIMFIPDAFVGLIGIRAPIWQGTKLLIKENFLTGAGIGSFSKIYPSFRIPEYFLFPDAAPKTMHSHNEFLETFAELGITGLLIYMCFILSVFIFVLKGVSRIENSFKRILIYGLISGVTGLFIQNIFSVSLRIPFITFYPWIGIGISAGLITNKDPGFIKINYGNRAKRLIFAFIFLCLIVWSSIRFALFPFLGDFYFQKGYLERRKGSMPRAISHYSRALKFSPLREDIYYKRAFILEKSGKEKEALKDYLKVEKLSPGYAKIYLNSGITYLSLGDLRNAIAELQKAVSANPYDSHAHNSLGAAYAKSGYPEKAKEEFERALSLDPTLKEARLNLIKLRE
jgi:O-antigen ligase